MKKQFKPGDKIKWYRDTTPIPGTVLKVTPKRVKIETIRNDGRPTVHYVSPKSIRITPPNEPRLQPQVGEKINSKAPDPYSARNTLLWQILASLLCLGVGGGLLSLMTLWANQWELYYSDGSKHDFWLGTVYAAIGLLVLTGYMTKKQFDEALTPEDVFRASIRAAFWGWVWSMIYYGVMLLLMLLLGGGFLMVAAELAFSFISIMAFGVIIGAIQYFRLKFEGFDQVRHRQRLSPEADLAACKAGVLPYRARVRALWYIVLMTLFTLLSIAGVLVMAPTKKGDAEAFLLFIAVVLGAVGITMVFEFKKSLTNIAFIEGDISEKKSYSSSRGPTHYYLICNNQNFKTDVKIWEKISEGSEYRLWYSPTNMVVIAYELINYKPNPIDEQQQRAVMIIYIDQNRHKFIEKALRRGLQGPVPRIELERDLHLPNKSLINDLVYNFDIPTSDGRIHILSSIVPAELTQVSRQALESQAKIDELVQRLVNELSRLRGDKKLDEIHSVVDNWPLLVALGGEIVPLLISAHESEDITTQVLIIQLLGDIARDTSTKLSQQAPNLLCQYCLVRCAAHEAKVYWRVGLSWVIRPLTYYGCRTCSQSRTFLPHTGSIVVVLDERMEEHYVRAEALKVNWFIQKKVFDFDKVEIVQASDEAVERFAMQVGNDTDEVRRPRYKRMPCTVSASCGLSPNSIRILQRTFGQVRLENDG